MKNERTLKVLRFSDLVRLGILNNRMTLRRWIQRGIFPKPITLGPNSLAWRESDIEAYLERAAAAGNVPKKTA